MSLNYTIGDLFLQGLDDYGISSQTIREGVLTAKNSVKSNMMKAWEIE